MRKSDAEGDERNIGENHHEMAFGIGLAFGGEISFERSRIGMSIISRYLNVGYAEPIYFDCSLRSHPQRLWKVFAQFRISSIHSADGNPEDRV